MKVFLEIGCADFDTLLPLAEKGGWCGHCVEPVPKHAATLRERAASLPVAIHELAISDRNSNIRMVVGGAGDDGWALGASHVIEHDHLGNRMLDHPANKHLRQEEIEVQAMRLDCFLDDNGIDRIDFMKIDVEGHELNILENYNWSVKPAVIKIEHKHLPGNRLDEVLKNAGYTLFIETDDIYAIL